MRVCVFGIRKWTVRREGGWDGLAGWREDFGVFGTWFCVREVGDGCVERVWRLSISLVSQDYSRSRGPMMS